MTTGRLESAYKIREKKKNTALYKEVFNSANALPGSRVNSHIFSIELSSVALLFGVFFFL